MKYHYDLHIHSALSPCGDDDMTPNNIVNMSMLNGLDIIAVSDHNSCGNVPALQGAAKRSGILCLPATELETAEEIHVLCLFSDADGALAFDREIVTPALPPIPNNERIFGRQVLFDADDNETGTDTRYLINATSITIDAVPSLVARYGGVALPAHIDKQTKSIISVLGAVDERLGFESFELSKNAPDGFVISQPSLAGRNYRYIHNSDAHYLYDIADAESSGFFEFETAPALHDIINLLNGKK